jgi:hypothetical protein
MEWRNIFLNARGLTGCRNEAKRKAPPNVLGETEAERFDNAVRKLFSVPKEAFLKEEARLKKARERKKRAKKIG